MLKSFDRYSNKAIDMLSNLNLNVNHDEIRRKKKEVINKLYS